MSGRVVIPFVENILDTDGVRSPAWGVNNGELILRCICGRLTGIRTHTVAASGEVSPSIWDRDGCDWHVWAMLADYEGQT